MFKKGYFLFLAEDLIKSNLKTKDKNLNLKLYSKMLLYHLYLIYVMKQVPRLASGGGEKGV